MNRRLMDSKPAVGMQIDDEVIRHILDKLDKLQGAEPFERADERFPYRRRGVELEVEHIGGTKSRLRVWTRNLSAGGISLLHGSFVHPGSRCELTLPRRDGQPQQVTGTVRWCRLLSGIVHELGVQFEQALDMELFINVATLREQRAEVDGRRRTGPSRADLIDVADSLMLEIDHLIEPPNLNRAKDLCRRMQQIALQLKFDELESSARLALDSLRLNGSVARSEPLLRRVQGLAQQLTMLRAQES